MSSSRARNGSSGAQQSQGIQPRYRRAFGCVTWIYMGTLAFLAVASLGMMPIWFIAGWDLFSILEGITFYAILIFLPILILGAVVGARTYRSDRREATRNGAAVGTVVGLAGFAFPIWLENIIAGGNVLYWLAAPPMLLAGLLLTYAVFPGKADFQQRRNLVVFAALLTGVTGIALLAFDFSLLQVFVAVVATLSGTAGGWTAGIGHARAGGEEMLPPAAGRVD